MCGPVEHHDEFPCVASLLCSSCQRYLELTSAREIPKEPECPTVCNRMDIDLYSICDGEDVGDSDDDLEFVWDRQELGLFGGKRDEGFYAHGDSPQPST